jgi:TRAP-type mannitol/chloroaromatic compound transport system substrate-binding protein
MKLSVKLVIAPVVAIGLLVAAGVASYYVLGKQEAAANGTSGDGAILAQAKAAHRPRAGGNGEWKELSERNFPPAP